MTFTLLRRTLVLAVLALTFALPQLSSAETALVTQNYPAGFKLTPTAGGPKLGNWWIDAPRIQVSYEALVKDALTGVLIPKDAQVTVGQKLLLEFKIRKCSDVFWFGSAGAYNLFSHTVYPDSPYGCWVETATGRKMTSDDYFGKVLTEFRSSLIVGDGGKKWYGEGGTRTEIYTALSAHPPTLSLEVPANLSCDALSAPSPEGSRSAECVVTESGDIPLNFKYSETYARLFTSPSRFLYPYYQTQPFVNGAFVDGILKYGDDVRTGGSTFNGQFAINPTLAQYSYTECSNGGCIEKSKAVDTQSAFVADLPAVSIPYTLKAAVNQPPSPPVIESADRVCIGSALAITVKGGIDPDGHNIRYGISFNGALTPTQMLPNVGYVPSGSELKTARTWNTAGTKVIRALTQDEFSAASSWTEKTITVSDTDDCAPAITVMLTATPSTIGEGESTTLKWSTTGNPTSCTARANPSATGWSGSKASLSGTTHAETVRPTESTAFTITCEKDGRTVTDRVEVAVTCAATPWVCLPDGVTLDNSCSTRACALSCTPGGNSCNGEGTTTFDASPTRVRIGETVDLIWNLDNAGSCIINDGRTDLYTIDGNSVDTKISNPIYGETTFTLSCTNAPEQKRTVKLLPMIREI